MILAFWSKQRRFSNWHFFSIFFAQCATRNNYRISVFNRGISIRIFFNKQGQTFCSVTKECGTISNKFHFLFQRCFEPKQAFGQGTWRDGSWVTTTSRKYFGPPWQDDHADPSAQDRWQAYRNHWSVQSFAWEMATTFQVVLAVNDPWSRIIRNPWNSLNSVLYSVPKVNKVLKVMFSKA